MSIWSALRSWNATVCYWLKLLYNTIDQKTHSFICIQTECVCHCLKQAPLSHWKCWKLIGPLSVLLEFEMLKLVCLTRPNDTQIFGCTEKQAKLSLKVCSIYCFLYKLNASSETDWQCVHQMHLWYKIDWSDTALIFRVRWCVPGGQPQIDLRAKIKSETKLCAGLKMCMQALNIQRQVSQTLIPIVFW